MAAVGWTPDDVGEMNNQARSAAVRVRVGIVLWLASWVPFPVIFGMDGTARVITWTIQIVVGIVGLALAGSAFAGAVKSVGWKNAPRVVGSALLHGSS